MPGDPSPASALGGTVRRLNSLTGLRYVAALAVVLLHTVSSRANPSALVRLPSIEWLVGLGYLGVAFFFILSGFVLTWGFQPDGSRSSFYRRRFARVYPMHFLTAVAMGAAVAIGGRAIDPGTVVVVLLLVQSWVPDPAVYFGLNGVSWSLACEAFFYAISPFLIPRLMALTVARRWFVAAVAMVVTSAVAAAFFVVPGLEAWNGPLWVNPAFNASLFVCGSVLALSVREERAAVRTPVAVGVPLVTLGVLVVTTQMFDLSRPMATVMAVPAMLVIIAGGARRDLAGTPGLAAHRGFVRLGEWSFALYLTHGFVLRVLEDVLTVPVQSGVSGLLLLFVVLLASTALAGLAYEWIEKPLERRLRSAPSRPLPGPATPQQR